MGFKDCTSLLLVGCVMALFSKEPSLRAQSDDPRFTPHRIIGNIYDVGEYDVSCFLITTNQGHILLNSGWPRTPELIRAHMERLGFRMTDIKVLLTNNSHGEVIGGLAQIKRWTGATVEIMAGDEDVVRSGVAVAGGHRYRLVEPCQVDKVLHDLDEVRLGDAALVAHLTPGHTRGATTWTLRAVEKGKAYDVVILDAPPKDYKEPPLLGDPEYPQRCSDYALSFRIIKGLHCDVLLSSHSLHYLAATKEVQTEIMRGGYANLPRDATAPRQFLAAKEKQFLDELASQMDPEIGRLANLNYYRLFSERFLRDPGYRKLLPLMELLPDERLEK